MCLVHGIQSSILAVRWSHSAIGSRETDSGPPAAGGVPTAYEWRSVSGCLSCYQFSTWPYDHMQTLERVRQVSVQSYRAGCQANEAARFIVVLVLYHYQYMYSSANPAFHFSPSSLKLFGPV